MTPYILDLLERLNNRNYRPGEEVIENSWESAKTISYAAMLEVQQLSDDTLLPELIRFFKDNPKDDRRYNILFMIKAITGNTQNKPGLDFVYDLFIKTKNKRDIESCLGFYSSRAALSNDYPLTPFINLLDHKVESVRISSYKAIANSHHPDKETLLLTKLSSMTRLYEIENALQALAQFCSSKHKKTVEKYLKSKSSRVRDAAKSCIVSMNLRDGSSLESQLKGMPHMMQIMYNMKKQGDQ
jgi:hypothetical protein